MDDPYEQLRSAAAQRRLTWRQVEAALRAPTGKEANPAVRLAINQPDRVGNATGVPSRSTALREIFIRLQPKTAVALLKNPRLLTFALGDEREKAINQLAHFTMLQDATWLAEFRRIVGDRDTEKLLQRAIRRELEERQRTSNAITFVTTRSLWEFWSPERLSVFVRDVLQSAIPAELQRALIDQEFARRIRPDIRDAIVHPTSPQAPTDTETPTPPVEVSEQSNGEDVTMPNPSYEVSVYVEALLGIDPLRYAFAYYLERLRVAARERPVIGPIIHETVKEHIARHGIEVPDPTSPGGKHTMRVATEAHRLVLLRCMCVLLPEDSTWRQQQLDNNSNGQAA